MEATGPCFGSKPLDPEAILSTPVGELVADGFTAVEVAEYLGVMLRREHRFLERLSIDLRHRQAFLADEAERASTPEVAADFRGQAAALGHALLALYDAVEAGCGVALGGPFIGGEIALHLAAADPEDGIDADGHPRLTPFQMGVLPPSLWDELGLPHPAPPLDIPDALRPGLDTEAYRAGLQALFEVKGYASPWTACRDAGLTPQEQRVVYRFLRGEVYRAPHALIGKLGPLHGIRPEGIKRAGYALLAEYLPDEIAALQADEVAAATVGGEEDHA